jgi:iron uptake system EfeUOB component EfeO/EfeM
MIRRGAIGTVVSVLISSIALGGCGNYKKEAIDYHFGLHGAPTEAQQASSSHATRTYRALIVQSSQRFASAAGKLRDAAHRGDINEAQRQWAIAQASYDMVCGEITAQFTVRT